MFAGHDPFLVALSVAVAILGGYTGFGLAARLRASPGANRRLLLAVGAAFLALGIWTMQFIGMLAAPMPPDVVYLTLPTVSFARPHKYVRCDPALPSTGSAEFSLFGHHQPTGSATLRKLGRNPKAALFGRDQRISQISEVKRQIGHRLDLA